MRFARLALGLGLGGGLGASLRGRLTLRGAALRIAAAAALLLWIALRRLALRRGLRLALVLRLPWAGLAVALARLALLTVLPRGRLALRLSRLALRRGLWLAGVLRLALLRLAIALARLALPERRAGMLVSRRPFSYARRAA